MQVIQLLRFLTCDNITHQPTRGHKKENLKSSSAFVCLKLSAKMSYGDSRYGDRSSYRGGDRGGGRDGGYGGGGRGGGGGGMNIFSFTHL